MDKKEERKARRANRVCIDCRCQDERTIAGFSRCARCTENHRKSDEKYRSKNVERMKAYQRERRARLLSVGKCYICGNRSEEGHTLCAKCLEKMRVWAKNRRRKDAKK